MQVSLTKLYTLLSILLSLAVKAQVPIYFSQSDTDTLLESASILMSELGKSKELNFVKYEEEEFNGNGIVLSAQPGMWLQFTPGLKKLGVEGVVIKSTGRGTIIVGNSKMAVRQGVFLYLESLGFRYYFPHPDWYIIPQNPDLYKKYEYQGQPSFDHRRLWYGYGTVGSKFSDDNYKFWFQANKLGGSMEAYVGHAYDDIVYRNKEEFKKHPDWFYPKLTNDVIPDNPKFDLSNPALVQFVTDDVLKRLEQAKQKNKPLKMITMSPSDGGGTCNTPACQQLGTVTDRVYSLINHVARVVRQKYPGTWVSGMAYADYSAPPTKKLEPNTFVSIATAFNPSKYSIDELITLWSKKAGKTGMYDYLGLYVWDLDIPGQGQGSEVDKTALKIKNYYRLGARGYEAESTPGSINKGLGHYVVSRMLWDVNTDVAAIKKEFFKKCFGKAASLMENLWQSWESYPYTIVRESDLASWIDTVEEANRTEEDSKVRRRLMHIKVYLHYLFLYNNYRTTSAEPELLKILTYSYNTFDWAAFSGYPALWVLGNTSSIAGLKFADPKAKYKIKDNSFNSESTINNIIIADRKKLIRKATVKSFILPRQFQKPAVPSLFNEAIYERNLTTTAFTGPHTFIFEIKNTGSSSYFDFAGGYVTGGGGDRPIVLTISPYTGKETQDIKPVIEISYTGKKDTQRIDLKKLPKGYYMLKVNDPGKIFRIFFSPAISYSMLITPLNRFSSYSLHLCFYVPKGTTTFRVFKDISAKLISPTGREVDMSTQKAEEIDVPVLKGEEGLWMILFVNGKFHIEGVPPFIGINPYQMLIPK